MAAALAWEFPMPPYTPPKPSPLSREELDVKLAKYLEDRDEDEKGLKKGISAILEELAELKTDVLSRFRGVEARLSRVENKQNQLTTDSGSWDLDKLKAEMELKLAQRDLAAEKSRPKGVFEEYGPKILSHLVTAAITGVVAYALAAALHGVH